MTEIEITGISKQFGKLKALDDVHIRLEKGKIYGLLGRNGAGKSTLLNILSGRIRPTAGHYTVDEEKPSSDRVLQKIYHVGPDNLFPNEKISRIFRNVKLFMPLFNLDGALADLAKFGLTPDRRFAKLSTGNASIVKTIIALHSGADYVFLDEPTLGHDAVNREIFYENVLSTFAEQGNCILLSSHLIAELSPLVQEVIFIDGGKLVLQEDKSDLLARFVKLVGPAQAMNALLQEQLREQPVFRRDVGAVAEVVIARPNVRPQLLEKEGIRLSAVDLQELFVALTRSDRADNDRAELGGNVR